MAALLNHTGEGRQEDIEVTEGHVQGQDQDPEDTASGPKVDPEAGPGRGASPDPGQRVGLEAGPGLEARRGAEVGVEAPAAGVEARVPESHQRVEVAVKAQTEEVAGTMTHP